MATAAAAALTRAGEAKALTDCAHACACELASTDRRRLDRLARRLLRPLSRPLLGWEVRAGRGVPVPDATRSSSGDSSTYRTRPDACTARGGVGGAPTAMAGADGAGLVGVPGTEPAAWPGERNTRRKADSCADADASTAGAGEEGEEAEAVLGNDGESAGPGDGVRRTGKCNPRAACVGRRRNASMAAVVVGRGAGEVAPTGGAGDTGRLRGSTAIRERTETWAAPCESAEPPEVAAACCRN